MNLQIFHKATHGRRTADLSVPKISAALRGADPDCTTKVAVAAFRSAKTVARSLFVRVPALVMAGLGVWLSPIPAFAQQSSAMQTWQQNITDAAPAQVGCYQTSYPNTQWQPVACAQSQNPDVPTALPRQTGTGTGAGAPAAPIGAGTDYAAIATPGSTISSAVGSFLNVTGASSIKSSSENQGDKPNTYSLQINTNQFTFTDSNLCRSSTGSCTGWQQFIYSNDSAQQGSVHIQYWILPAGINSNSCPSMWDVGRYDDGSFAGCFLDSGSSVSTPGIAPSSLGNITLTGNASTSTDAVIININGKAYATVRNSIFKSLPQKWTLAEFNIFGYYSKYPTASFNDGARMVVKTAINNGSTNAPICSTRNGGQTYEGSNLYFNSYCCPYDGASPAIAFTQGTSDTLTAACPALSGTVAPTTYTVTANASPSIAATLNPASVYVTSGTTILFTMTQRAGYGGLTGAAFTNGTSCPLTSLGGADDVYQFKLGPITSNCSIVGYFDPPKYTVSVIASPSSMATISPASAQVTVGDYVVFTMTQQPGHGLTSAIYATGNGTVCPLTTLGGSGNVYQFRIGPITGNCSILGYFN